MLHVAHFQFEKEPVYFMSQKFLSTASSDLRKIACASNIHSSPALLSQHPAVVDLAPPVLFNVLMHAKFPPIGLGFVSCARAYDIKFEHCMLERRAQHHAAAET